ncbi:signal peptide protein [Rhodopirellula sp. SWK7]|nr:signal peptide protein [Rhodopirellula sp. SWK7]
MFDNHSRRAGGSSTKAAVVGFALVVTVMAGGLLWTSRGLAISPVVDSVDDQATDSAVAASSDDAATPDLLSEIEERPEEPPPFDYAPYRVLIWVASDDPRINTNLIRDDLLNFLDRDFYSVWRTVVADAPPAVASIARRDLSSITFASIAASDPVIALKKGHPDSLRIHFASDAGRFLDEIPGTQGRIQDILKRIDENPESKTTPAKFAWKEKLRAIDGDAVALQEMWKEESTEAILVSRGMADTLTDPKAKLIVPPLDGQVVQAIEQFDKIYIARLKTKGTPPSVEVIELDTLMRHFGSVMTRDMISVGAVAESVGAAVRDAFSPIVRIDNAGQKSATGLVRASGLALDKNSPAHVRVGDVLEPLVRKDDRNGSPITIGPLDWAYLYVTEKKENMVEMDFFAGRMGGLQGRKNNRTHRMGVVVRPQLKDTMLRLHAKGKPNDPLIGYEIYDKELDSTSMTFVGRTDWNGRLIVGKIDRPLRLLYVKNGGAVLARLPIVPGHHEISIADLAGDDMRLQAEAYIRGVQNAIIDLVAVRELFKARISMRIKEGKLKEADELLEMLRNEPSNEKIANDMGKKQTMFLKAIGRNANQQRKVDEMFSTTRELLSKHINPKVVNDLETALIEAEKNAGAPRSEDATPPEETTPPEE